jgi:hypothetical protein
MSNNKDKSIKDRMEQVARQISSVADAIGDYALIDMQKETEMNAAHLGRACMIREDLITVARRYGINTVPRSPEAFVNDFLEVSPEPPDSPYVGKVEADTAGASFRASVTLADQGFICTSCHPTAQAARDDLVRIVKLYGEDVHFPECDGGASMVVAVIPPYMMN